MMLKVLFIAAAIGATYAQQCGVPAIPPKDSRVDSLINVLTGKSNGRIVAGIEARPHSFPWQAAMLSRVGAPTANCGGSIISDQFILTAAHCCAERNSVRPRPLSAIKIRVGAHDLRLSEPNAKTYSISRLVIHSSYHPGNLQNDFCLLKLSEKLTYSDHVAPICLAEANDGPVGQSCIVSGWGSVLQYQAENQRPPQRVSSVLRQVDESIISNDECKKIHEGINGITSDMVCGYTRSKGSCQGDSGGPFVCQSAPGEPFKLVGVVSWGLGCADTRFPGVYARTSSALTWIAQVLAAN